jgi:hypothetical protein
MTSRAPDAEVPVTWPDLIAQYSASVERGLADIAQVPGQLADSDEPSTWLRADSFTAPATTLAMAAALLGPARCRQYVRLLAPFVPSTLQELTEEGVAENADLGTSMLSFTNVVQCCGDALAADVGAVESSWLAELAADASDLRDLERRKLALAALATGATHLVPAFIKGGALPTQFVAGQTFDFNVQGFIRYLAVAIERRASADDVAPAWRTFVDRFPRKLAAETLDWLDLLWAARAVVAVIGRQPVGTVAQQLHTLVAQ